MKTLSQINHTKDLIKKMSGKDKIELEEYLSVVQGINEKL